MNQFELPLSRTTIECGLWYIKRELAKRVGWDEAERLFYPLAHYVGSGRASVDAIRRLLGAKPFMVARKLMKGGSDDEVMLRIKQYIGTED